MDENLVQVTHNELKDTIHTCYTASLPLFVWGAIGIGKSQMVKAVTEELGIQLIDVRISQLDPSDLRGLPKYDGETTKWLPPNWLPQDKTSKGILFLDELNLAPPTIQASCYQLILDRRIGDYILPEGWIVIGAGNRVEDRANIFAMGAPLRNRLPQVELKKPTLDKWTEWALNNNVERDIVTFLQWKSEYLHTFEKYPDASVFATHRSWGYHVDKMLKNAAKGVNSTMLIASAVGLGIAREFEAFRKLHKKINLSEIIKKPEMVKEIKAVDEKYCLVSALSGLYTEEKRKDNKLKDILPVCNAMDPEFGLLLARFLRNGNKYFVTDFKLLARKDDKTIKTFIEKYWKYLSDEDLKASA